MHFKQVCINVNFMNDFIQFYLFFLKLADNYILRGTIVISNPKDKDISIKHDHPLTDYESAALKVTCANTLL